ncbi:MAG: sensor histidine kinase [Bacteroidota bacterium]
MRRLAVAVLAVLVSVPAAPAQDAAVVDSLERAIQVARTDADRAAVLVQLSELHRYTDLEQAFAFARQAVAAAERSGDPFREGEALYHLAVLHQMAGEPARALVLHERVGELAQRVARSSPERSRRLAADNAVARGVVLRDVGDAGGAAEEYLRALRLAEADGRRRTAASALLELHELYLERGEAGLARDYARRAREEYGALGDTATELRMMGAEAAALLLGGDPEGAAEAYRRVVRQARAAGQRMPEAQALLGLGQSLVAAGRPSEAADALESGLVRVREGELRDDVPEFLVVLSEAERLAGRLSAAVGHAEEAVRAAEGMGSLGLGAEARGALAAALAATGDHRAAYEERVRLAGLRNVLQSRERADALADAEVRYEVDRRRREAEAAGQRAEIAELQTDRQRAWLVGSAVALVLLGALVAALWRTARLQRRANGLLTERAAEVDRQRAEVEAALDRTERLLGEREVLLREVHHRVKNNLQVVASLVNLQADGVGDGAAQAALRQMRARVEAMALVHRRLYDDDLRTVDAAAYLGDLAGLLAGTYGWSEAELETDLAPVVLDADTAVPLGLAAAELVANAFEHAFPAGGAGRVRLALSREVGRLRLVVEDDGVGLQEGLTGPPTGSLGLQLASDLAAQVGGAFEMGRSERLGGARFVVEVPAPRGLGASLARAATDRP